jgi:hypothetical protein
MALSLRSRSCPYSKVNWMGFKESCPRVGTDKVVIELGDTDD